jgi:hypothetical protein
MAVDYHAIAAATNRGSAQATTDIVSNTNKRDVSDVLDLLALAETPFINRVGWGAESGGTEIEWLSEDLGPGWVAVSAAVASAATSIIVASAGASGLSSAEAVKQVQTGTVMYHYSSTDGGHAIYAAVSVRADGSVAYEGLSTAAWASLETSVTAGDKFYILGAVANEGSLPRTGKWRARALRNNQFTILRQDVQITGSEKMTDMYAIGREDLHQIRMRLKEMQRERERIALYSAGVTPRSTTEASMSKGALGFLSGQSGAHIDTTSTTLIPSAMNTVVNTCWDYGASNLAFLGDINQCAKFTQWDIDRIRMAPRDGRGGGHVTYWMSEAGIEIEIIPMRQVPTNIAFVLDLPKCQLRAKKGRKAIMEKLGKAGDFDDWQILSEFSFEMRGYDHACHGMFTKLS